MRARRGERIKPVFPRRLQRDASRHQGFDRHGPGGDQARKARTDGAVIAQTPLQADSLLADPEQIDGLSRTEQPHQCERANMAQRGGAEIERRDVTRALDRGIDTGLCLRRDHLKHLLRRPAEQLQILILLQMGQPGHPGVRGNARSNGWTSVVSARSGETEDVSISHLATGLGNGLLKVGSFTRSERMAKWNECLRIEEQLGAETFVGGKPLSATWWGRSIAT